MSTKAPRKQGRRARSQQHTVLVDGVPCVPVVTVGDRVLYALQPKQFEAYKLTPLWHDGRGPVHIGYGGAAGGAKSHATRAVAMAVAMAWQGSTGIIFRQTEDEVFKNHLNKILTEVPRELKIDGRTTKLYDWNGQQRCFTWFNGSRTYLGYLRHETDVFRYQGPEFDFMGFEESTHYSWKQVSWLVSNRLRASVPGARPFAFYPSNPGNRGHFWYKRLFVDRNFRENERPGDYAFVQAMLSDNQILVQRDPAYAGKLDMLEEPWRSWLRDGDFSAGAGSGLPELSRAKHLIQPFEVPEHWPRFGGFDWGYEHPFSFGEYAINEDGWVFKLLTITGQRKLPDQIAERILRDVKPERLRYIAAGHDTFNVRKAAGETVPTIAEQMGELGRKMIPANVERVRGLNNMRAYTAWKHRGDNGEPGEPRFYLFDNPGNRKCFEQLETMVTDPDDPEDVLKVDADDFGEGGDDSYDETRYALASRPLKAASQFDAHEVSAFRPEALAAEAARRTQFDGRVKVARRGRPIHPELGGYY